jgi:RNA polymerase sigma-70 factor, ECF subfamily
VAVGFADGPRAGLALLEAAARDERLARYQPLHAARAELLTRAGEDADEAHARAIELTGNEAERAALSRRRAS